VLQKDDFFVDGFRVVEKVKVRDLVGDTLSSLSIVVQDLLLLGSLDVVKVELVRVQNYLGAIVE